MYTYAVRNYGCINMMGAFFFIIIIVTQLSFRSYIAKIFCFRTWAFFGRILPLTTLSTVGFSHHHYWMRNCPVMSLRFYVHIKRFFFYFNRNIYFISVNCTVCELIWTLFGRNIRIKFDQTNFLNREAFRQKKADFRHPIVLNFFTETIWFSSHNPQHLSQYKINSILTSCHRS